MAARYELDAEHVAFVTGSGESTNKVQSIVEEAEELREREAVEHSGDAFLPGETLDGVAGGEGEEATADGEDDGDADGEGDGQATLTDAAGAGADAGSGEEPGAEDRAETAEDDDEQSGLSDFF
jgi:replication factor C large subunit